MTLDQHLTHLLWLMEDYPAAWREHCWHRAKEIAQQPGFEELPAMLAAAVASRRAASTASSSKQPEPPKTAAAETTPAAGPTAPLKASTGLPAS